MTEASSIPSDPDEVPIDDSARTYVDPPRRRQFLPQTGSERIRAVWWRLVQATFFGWSRESWCGLRRGLLRLFGAEIDSTAFVHPSVRIDYPWNLRVLPDVVIAHEVIITCMGTVTIGARTRVSQYAHLCAGTHDYQRDDMSIMPAPIVVGEDVWIAADAFVGPGVTLGDGVVLAARSSAFHDLPEGMVCIGEPARPRRPRQVEIDGTSSGMMPEPT